MLQVLSTDITLEDSLEIRDGTKDVISQPFRDDNGFIVFY